MKRHLNGFKSVYHLLRIFHPHTLRHWWLQIRNKSRICLLNPRHCHLSPFDKLSLHFHSWTTSHLLLSFLPDPPHPHSKFLLLSDSLSSLKAMQDSYSSNPVVQRIHILLHTLLSSLIAVSFLWISGHINLPDHDMVDTAAIESLQSPKISDPSAPPPCVWPQNLLPFTNSYLGRIFGPNRPPTNWNILIKSQSLGPLQTELSDMKKLYSPVLE